MLQTLNPKPQTFPEPMIRRSALDYRRLQKLMFKLFGLKAYRASGLGCRDYSASGLGFRDYRASGLGCRDYRASGLGFRSAAKIGKVIGFRVQELRKGAIGPGVCNMSSLQETRCMQKVSDDHVLELGSLCDRFKLRKSRPFFRLIQQTAIHGVRQS